MKRTPESLRFVVYETTPEMVEITSQRLTGLGHVVTARLSARPLLYHSVRDESMDVVTIGLDQLDHRGLDVVRSLAELKPIPVLIVADSVDSAPEELSGHPGVAIVRRGASDAELDMRIGEAWARCHAHRDHLHRLDRLKARVRHEGQVALAKSLLMNRLHLSEGDAYALLRTASQDQRVKLEEVARKVVEEGPHAIQRLRNEDGAVSNPSRFVAR